MPYTYDQLRTLSAELLYIASGLAFLDTHYVYLDVPVRSPEKAIKGGAKPLRGLILYDDMGGLPRLLKMA